MSISSSYEYDLFNETALKYARESLECDKDIPAVYHIIGRLTSPDTSEYEKIKKDLKKLKKVLDIL